MGYTGREIEKIGLFRLLDPCVRVVLFRLDELHHTLDRPSLHVQKYLHIISELLSSLQGPGKKLPTSSSPTNTKW